MTTQSIPILMYHQVSPQPARSFRKYTITPAVFGLQMQWLRMCGYHAITLDALVAHRTRGAGLPARPVVITFDDGFRDCAEYAIPILRRHGFTAIIFLVAGLMGRASEWLVAERGLALPLMDWQAARRLLGEGFALGAHTMSHPRLSELTPQACAEELVAARMLLETQLGQPVPHLAYPHGAYDARVRALAAEAGYASACSVRIGRSQPDDDLLALHRIPVNGTERFWDFVSRLRNGHTVREELVARLRGPHAGGRQVGMEVTK